MARKPLFDVPETKEYNCSQKYPGDMAMSICIAALCGNKENIICMCDKAITRDGVPHQTTQQGKMREPTNFVCLLLAGGMSKQDIIYYDVYWLLYEYCKNGGDLSQVTIGDVVDAYVLCHKEVVTKRGWAGDAPTYTIIAGYDLIGGHIVQIENGKIGECRDASGHLAVGSGSKYVGNHLDAERYNGYSSPYKTMLLMYIDKKLSEKDEYVGADTDLLIIQPGARQQRVERHHGIYRLLSEAHKDVEENSGDITDEIIDRFSKDAETLFKKEPLVKLREPFCFR